MLFTATVITRKFLLGWIAACEFAELAGIALGALWWVAIDYINPAPRTLGAKWLMLALKSPSGLVEGIVLAVSRPSCFAASTPHFPRRHELSRRPVLRFSVGG
jgi:hypothetical protein